MWADSLPNYVRWCIPIELISLKISDKLPTIKEIRGIKAGFAIAGKS